MKPHHETTMKQPPKLDTSLSSVANTVCEMLGIDTELGMQAVGIALRNLKTLDNKQKDYGRENLDEFGSYGVLIRTNDKMSRLKTLYSHGAKAKNESIADSWLDLANYGLIGYIMLLDEPATGKLQ